MTTPQYGNYLNFQNSGHQIFGENNLGTPLKWFLVPKNMQIASTASAAATQATYTALIKAAQTGRILPLPIAVEFKEDSQADKYQDRPFSGKKFVYEGKYGFDLELNVDKNLSAKLRNLNFNNFDVFCVDTNRNIWLYSPDGITAYGFSTTDVHFSKIGMNDGSKAAQQMMTIHLSNPDQWNKFGVFIDGQILNWDPNQLDGCYDVDLKVITSAATSFTVGVYYDGIPTTRSISQITGLAKADFVLTNAGVPVSLSAASITDNKDGTYTFTSVPTLSGACIVTLVSTANISVVGYQLDVLTQGTFSV